MQFQASIDPQVNRIGDSNIWEFRLKGNSPSSPYFLQVNVFFPKKKRRRTLRMNKLKSRIINSRQIK